MGSKRKKQERHYTKAYIIKLHKPETKRKYQKQSEEKGMLQTKEQRKR